MRVLARCARPLAQPDRYGWRIKQRRVDRAHLSDASRRRMTLRGQRWPLEGDVHGVDTMRVFGECPADLDSEIVDGETRVRRPGVHYRERARRQSTREHVEWRIAL